MANEQEEPPGDFHFQNLLRVESANIEGEAVAATAISLESTHSGESESTSSVVTQIETISSSSKVTRAKFPNAKEEEEDESGDQSSLTKFSRSDATSTTTTTSATATTTRIASTRVNYPMGSESDDENVEPSGNINSEEKGDDSPEKGDEKTGEGGDVDDLETYDDEEDDTTASSEAVVDDIELILMPETVQDFHPTDLSPQLVRVTELKRPVDYDTDYVFEDDEGKSEQESDFQKFGTDDEEGASERSVSSRSNLRRRVFFSSFGDGRTGGGENEQNEQSGRDYKKQKDGIGRKSSGKVNSGVQTEISALETTDTSSNPFELKYQGKSSTSRVGGLGLGMHSRSSGGGGKHHLNWKSELTLLPSKTKIRTTGFSGYDKSMNYQDQYSPRVAKFTSQDTLNSSSQFLKPSTLYRTRNLSRNLNCESSESTLVLPAAGLPSTSDSARYRDRISSSTSSNFKESSSHISCSARRQPLTSGQSVSFRSSLPDLSSQYQPDNKGGQQRQHSFKSMKHHKSSSGYRLTKKSSSDDDETSSLIDESERCLRSSIDLLLTDDFPSPGADISCRSTGFGGRGGQTTAHSFGGYYSSRRSNSQPVLIDEGECGDFRDFGLGSPFLPRKISDMRNSRRAKIILPNGHVAVVAVKELDELRDTLTVHTDTGCIISIPFRKIVFAWRMKR